ncbi:MAG: hypothetical protein NTZ09_00870 [Candidatus Hydrogenedentes bacterium]|nr:hypothetical protein [Candidatus Hydrogenedentota bacterium]
MNDSQSVCPVCEVKDIEPSSWPDHDGEIYNCTNCGRFGITRRARINLSRVDDRLRAVISHAIWRNQDVERLFAVTTTLLEAAEKETIPDPAEQLDRLILFLGHHQESSGSRIEINELNLRAKVGGSCYGDVLFVTREAAEMALIEITHPTDTRSTFRLTLKGWQRFHEIQRKAITSRTAFMAMPFDNAEVVAVVESVFRPAVEKTGFKLKRVDDETPAGLIDNKIRVDIQLCKFLIADLTCCNRGAYWEAGYAEGLGKPVIYTCNKYYFEQGKTHFDTNHCTTVIWDPGDLETAERKLKATIRATLPFEARLEDE